MSHPVGNDWAWYGNLIRDSFPRSWRGRFSRQNKPRQIELRSSQRTLPLRLCGETHPPQYCTTFSTAEERRTEARQRELFWKCFTEGHTSKSCKIVGPCPRCREDHHTSLCTLTVNGVSKGTEDQLPAVAYQGAVCVALPSENNRSMRHPRRSGELLRNISRCQAPYFSASHRTSVERKQPTITQCVLQMVSALIFNESEIDYQPVTILLDSGAQKKFYKEKTSRRHEASN